MRIDTLVHNARVRTVDPSRPTASSLGIWRGQVVGLDEDVDGVAAHRVVDLGGAAVVPGFHDAHCHTTSFGLQLSLLDLAGTLGRDATLHAVAEYARRQPPDGWVIGMGYGRGMRAGEHPARSELDRAAGGRPVWLTHLSGHAAAVSSRGLQHAGIVPGVPDPPGGRIERGPDGDPSGVLHESAMDLVKAAVGPSSVEQLAEAIGRAGRVYLAEGITSFTEAGVGCPGIDHSPVEVAAYQRARETGRLHTRAQLMVYSGMLHPVDAHPDDGLTVGLDLGLRTGFGDEWLSLGAMKIWLDGSGLEPPPSGPDQGFVDDPAHMTALIGAAHRAGWQVAAHAMGDAAVDLVLDAVAAAQARHPRPAVRHRVEHCALVRPDQVGRLAALGMTAVPQPVFLPEFGDLFRRVFGPTRTDWSFRVASLLEAGVPVAASSDRPVAPGAPLRGIQAMVERTTAKGRDYGAAERVDAATALGAYTRAGARAANQDRWSGRLCPGMRADFVVLSDDPVTVEPAAIGDLGVRATVVDGAAAHDPDGLFG